MQISINAELHSQIVLCKYKIVKINKKKINNYNTFQTL